MLISRPWTFLRARTIAGLTLFLQNGSAPMKWPTYARDVTFHLPFLLSLRPRETKLKALYLADPLFFRRFFQISSFKSYASPRKEYQLPVSRFWPLPLVRQPSPRYRMWSAGFLIPRRSLLKLKWRVSLLPYREIHQAWGESKIWRSLVPQNLLLQEDFSSSSNYFFNSQLLKHSQALEAAKDENSEATSATMQIPASTVTKARPLNPRTTTKPKPFNLSSNNRAAQHPYRTKMADDKHKARRIGGKPKVRPLTTPQSPKLHTTSRAVQRNPQPIQIKPNSASEKKVFFGHYSHENWLQVERFEPRKVTRPVPFNLSTMKRSEFHSSRKRETAEVPKKVVGYSKGIFVTIFNFFIFSCAKATRTNQNSAIQLRNRQETKVTWTQGTGRRGSRIFWS